MTAIVDLGVMDPREFLRRYPDFERIRFNAGWDECDFFFGGNIEPFTVSEFTDSEDRDNMHRVNNWARRYAEHGQEWKR